MSEIKNGRLGLYDAEHSKCNCIDDTGLQRVTLLAIHCKLSFDQYLEQPDSKTSTLCKKGNDNYLTFSSDG